MTSLITLLILLLVPLQILANTEIINFHVPVAPLPPNQHTQLDSYRRLHAGNDQIVLQGQMPRHHAPPCKDDDEKECPYEIWLVLDIDSWPAHYERFTLRVSWPASVRLPLLPPPLPL